MSCAGLVSFDAATSLSDTSPASSSSEWFPDYSQHQRQPAVDVRYFRSTHLAAPAVCTRPPVTTPSMTTKEVLCEECEEAPEAAWTCRECNISLCDGCHAHHRRSKRTSRHTTAPIAVPGADVVDEVADPPPAAEPASPQSDAPHHEFVVNLATAPACVAGMN